MKLDRARALELPGVSRFIKERGSGPLLFGCTLGALIALDLLSRHPHSSYEGSLHRSRRAAFAVGKEVVGGC